MPSYLVMWRIDVEADTPREAAQKALDTQRDPESIATVFNVWEIPEQVRSQGKETQLTELVDPYVVDFWDGSNSNV